MGSKIQPNKCLFSSFFVTIVEILLTFMYTELTETGSFKDSLNANDQPEDQAPLRVGRTCTHTHTHTLRYNFYVDTDDEVTTKAE